MLWMQEASQSPLVLQRWALVAVWLWLVAMAVPLAARLLLKLALVVLSLAAPSTSLPDRLMSTTAAPSAFQAAKPQCPPVVFASARVLRTSRPAPSTSLLVMRWRLRRALYG
jgi:hypothetical protein